MNYELTTIASLQPGDRFYKAGDKKQEVLVMIRHPAKHTGYQTYNHWYVPRIVADNSRLTEDMKLRNAKAIKATTEVIKLKSK